MRLNTENLLLLLSSTFGKVLDLFHQTVFLHLIKKTFSADAEAGCCLRSFPSCFGKRIYITVDRKYYLGNDSIMYDGIHIKPAFEIPEIEKLYGGSFTGGNSVHLLRKNGELFKAIFDSIAGAERFVCLEFYIFRNDETGIELAELLKKKAAEGVRIYMLYDHFGSFGTPRKFWTELKQNGINVRASHPFKWTAPLHYARRDHKKLILIAGEKAFTGGLNIANEYRGYYFKRHKEAWRDTGILLEGLIAWTLLSEFKKSWLLWGGKPIEPEVRSQKPETQDSRCRIQD